MSKTIEALEDMKQVLMERGWIQGDFDRDDGFCLMGSYTKSGVAEKYCSLTTAERVFAALRQVLAGRNLGMFQFNDTPGRTFNEVVDVIDEAILKEKELSR